jgi:alcohol dehydrogenase class IV
VRSFNRGPQAYRRERGGQRSTGKAFLIVTEGEKTEPNYFRALKKHLQLSNADVEVFHPPATDPISLTDEAIKLCNERARKAKKDSWSVEYDEVWVVYRRFGHRRTGDLLVFA